LGPPRLVHVLGEAQVRIEGVNGDYPYYQVQEMTAQHGRKRRGGQTKKIQRTGGSSHVLSKAASETMAPDLTGVNGRAHCDLARISDEEREQTHGRTLKISPPFSDVTQYSELRT